MVIAYWQVRSPPPMSVQVRPVPHSAWTPSAEQEELRTRAVAAGQMPEAGQARPVEQQTVPDAQAKVL
jgi:hypothetical protein